MFLIFTFLKFSDAHKRHDLCEICLAGYEGLYKKGWKETTCWEIRDSAGNTYKSHKSHRSYKSHKSHKQRGTVKNTGTWDRREHGTSELLAPLATRLSKRKCLAFTRHSSLLIHNSSLTRAGYGNRTRFSSLGSSR
jgi:hypothetical protein